MQRTLPYTIISRGAAAALLLAGGAALGRAQGVPVAPAAPGVVRARDTLFVRQVEPVRVRVDSIMVLFSALEREPFGSREWVMLRSKIDSLTAGMARMRVAPPADALPKGWIGINAGGVPAREMISDAGEVVRYLAYPSVVSVDPESPAQKAGIEPGDVLVAYNGIDVVDHDVNLTQLFVPDRKMLVTVRREGETKEYPVVVVRTPEHVAQRRLELSEFPARGRLSIARPPEPPLPPDPGVLEVRKKLLPGFSRIVTMTPNGMYVFAPDGVFGARVSVVGADLAKALKLSPGLLVNDVADESMAAKSGLRAGDVIVAAAGQSVSGLAELQHAIAMHLSDRAIELQVVRDRKPRKITVKW